MMKAKDLGNFFKIPLIQEISIINLIMQKVLK